MNPAIVKEQRYPYTPSPKWFHISKTYTWNKVLKRMIPSVGETYKIQPQSQRSIARQMGMTMKRFRKLAKQARRREQEITLA